ncbi:MAG: hypothetical protein M3N32_01315 [Actinomycetota bacterium]|nr:hypothetical protein [Actinomycetota bacterium]
MPNRRRRGPLFASLLALAVFASPFPAEAQNAPPGGICEGVLNQLRERGTVEENLLEAAARQNAELIRQLQQEQAALQNQRQVLEGQLAEAQKELEALQTKKTELQAQLAEAQKELEALQTKKTELEAQLAQKKTDLAQAQQELKALQTKKTELEAEIAQKQAQLEGPGNKTGIRNRIAELQKELQKVNDQIALKQQQINQLQLDITALQGELQNVNDQIAVKQQQITQLQEELKQVNDQIALKQQQITQLQEELKQVNARIAEIERQIQLGGCVAP